MTIFYCQISVKILFVINYFKVIGEFMSQIGNKDVAVVVIEMKKCSVQTTICHLKFVTE